MLYQIRYTENQKTVTHLFYMDYFLTGAFFAKRVPHTANQVMRGTRKSAKTKENDT